MVDIAEPARHRVALLHLGFRPFFLLAGLAGVALMLAWWWLYRSGGALPAGTALPAVSWHAHEMVYGYAMAVIAGFLLTAVRNWTGVQTLHGAPLLALALLWLLARLMPFVPHPAALPAMAVLDLAFGVILCAALLWPVWRSRQWAQLAVVSKVLLLVAGNSLFYLGVAGRLADGVHWGLYGGLYLVVSLILVMGRRVIPFFIEKGVPGPVTVRNRRWLDIASLVLMLAFVVVEVFLPSPAAGAALAWVLALLHALRLADWHARGIWRRPLLWVLFLGYAWLVAGFVLRGLQPWTTFSPTLAVHAFAVGGIGLMTVGMMARVALGHTGRNVFDPPPLLRWLFLCLLLAAAVRVLLPLGWPTLYGDWIALAQWLWMLAFAGFTAQYAPMLVRPRVDGRYG